MGRTIAEGASGGRSKQPNLGRKNYYGSGVIWSGRLAMTMFTILATLARWNINPRLWLTWFLESCATNGGQSPSDASILAYATRLAGTSKLAVKEDVADLARDWGDLEIMPGGSPWAAGSGPRFFGIGRSRL